MKIAIIASRFNEEITTLLQKGALERFEELGYPLNPKDIFSVPGAIEIPVVASLLARKNIYKAIVCLGAVIKGETAHFDYVCSQVSYGCQKIAIENHIPVIFGILTTDNEQQALDRCGGTHGHKGRDAVDVTMEMIALLARVHES